MNMKTMRSLSLLVCLVCLCAALLTACTKSANLLSGEKNTSGANESLPAGAPAGKGEHVSGPTPLPKLNMDKMHKLGEVVLSLLPAKNATPENMETIVELEYLVNKVTIFQNANESGIKPEKMVTVHDVVSDDAGFEDLKVVDPANTPMLLFDITVKNQNCSDPNIADLSLVYAEAPYGDVESLGDLAYFSNPKTLRRGEDWPHYYDYKLPRGQSADVQVGWLVDLTRYDKSNLYLCVKYGGDEPFVQYIDLDL